MKRLYEKLDILGAGRFTHKGCDDKPWLGSRAAPASRLDTTSCGDASYGLGLVPYNPVEFRLPARLPSRTTRCAYMHRTGSLVAQPFTTVVGRMMVLVVALRTVAEPSVGASATMKAVHTDGLSLMVREVSYHTW